MLPLSGCSAGRASLSARRPALWRRWAHAARAVPAASASAEAGQVTHQAAPQAVLQRLGDSGSWDEVVVSGCGTHQGTAVEWQLRWRRGDGAFTEHVQGRELSYSWGFDGGSRCWETQDSGCIRELQLDDFEGTLLSGVIRTGAWAGAPGDRLLDITLAADQQSAASSAPATTAAAAAVRGNGSASAGSTAVVIDPRVQEGSDSDGAQEAAPLQQQQQHPASGVRLAVRLKNGRVLAEVHVCSTAWHPLGMINRVCSDLEKWEFADWQEWPQGPRFPRVTLHHSGCGGLCRYQVEGVEGRSAQEAACDVADLLLSSSCFSMPQVPLLPPDTHFLPGAPADTPAWYAPSGHVLVQPTINGRRCGYMILDTGASGLVIEPGAAQELGLQAFGELHVTGMAGKVRSNFRRGETLELGPLVMQRPLFMEMECKGLVRGAPGPVIGIVGYEVFRRAVIDIPPRPSSEDAELAANSNVLSAAAAFAASVTGGGLGRVTGQPASAGPAQAVPYTIRLFNPEALHGSECEPSVDVGSANGGGGSSSSSSSSSGSRSSADSAAAATLDVLPWQPCTFVANLPHVEAHYTPGMRRGLAPLTSLFMLDSGAGGVDVMFSASGAAAFEEASGKHRFIKGVGGDSNEHVKVTAANLAWLELGGARFEGVHALLAREERAGAGIELSVYSAGIICGDLLSRCRLVLDYPRSRLAVVPPEE